MNKKYLLILAALGLKGVAWAQSQVTLQGTTDVYIQSASTGATHFTGEGEGGSAASRLAFRGSEDLGGGLRVNFLLEGGLFMPTGAGTLPGPGFAFTRQSLVGVSGVWGSVDLGRMYTPMFYTLLRADPFNVNTLFSSLNLIAATDAQPALRTFAARASGMIRYRTPTQQPWIASVGYSFGNETLPEVVGGEFGFDNKKFYAGYGFQKSHASASAAPGTASKSSFYQVLSGAWQLTHDVRISGNFSRIQPETAGSTTARVWELGAAWEMSSTSRLLASGAERKVSGSPRGQLTLTLGYDYLLSKHTRLYGRWLGLNNRANAAVSLASIPVAANSGDDVRVLAIGMRHDF